MHPIVDRVEVLQKHHNRHDFDCGEATLNDYLKRQAGQDARRHLGITHVAISATDENRVICYYTLAMSSVEPSAMPDKTLPTQIHIPVVLLGRLAVDLTCRGTGLGQYLLMHALARAERLATSEIGAVAVVVDAFPEAREFYGRYGFQRLVDDELHLYLSMKTISKLQLNP